MTSSRFPVFILALCTLALAACSSTPELNEVENVRFALRDDAIASWQETDNGFAIQLNSEGQRKLCSLTRNNPDKTLEIYAGRIFVSSTTIHEPLRGTNLAVQTDDDIKDRVMAFLPAAKRTY